MGRKKKERRDGTAVLRRVVSFDEKSRRCFIESIQWLAESEGSCPPLHLDDIKEFLTGFHKRKVERRKAALEEIKRKLKEEEKKMKEERHKEYMKMLKEREEALEEADELEHLVTSQTESVSYDHPNHTVTVTTISDLDLSGARVLGLTENENTDLEGEDALNTYTLPKKARDPLLSERISSLTASLHSHTQKKRKRKQINHKQGIKNRGQKTRTGRTSKSQRRKMTGRKRQVQD